MAIFQNVLKEAFESSGNYESALNKAFSLFDKPTMVSMVGKEYAVLSKPRLYKNSIDANVENFTHSEMAFNLLDPYQINSTSIGGGYADWVSTTTPKDLNSQFKDMYDYLMNIDEINISRRLSDDDMDYLQEKIVKAKKEKRIGTSSYSGEGHDKAINFLNNRQVTASNTINNTSVNTSTTKNASTPMDNLKKILSKTNPERRMWTNRNFVFGENYTNNKDFSREVLEFYANTENTGKLFEKIAKFSDLEYTPEDFAIYENMFDAYKRATGQTTEEVQQQIVNQFRDWKVSPEESQKHFRLIKEAAEEVGWQGSYDHLNYDFKLWTTNIDQAEQVVNTIPRTNTDSPTKSAPFRNATKSYRPDIIMNGNNVDFDSIYNHTTVRKVKANTTNTTASAEAAVNQTVDQPAGPKQGDAFWDKKNKRQLVYDGPDSVHGNHNFYTREGTVVNSSMDDLSPYKGKARLDYDMLKNYNTELNRFEQLTSPYFNLKYDDPETFYTDLTKNINKIDEYEKIIGSKYKSFKGNKSYHKTRAYTSDEINKYYGSEIIGEDPFNKKKNNTSTGQQQQQEHQRRQQEEQQRQQEEQRHQQEQQRQQEQQHQEEERRRQEEQRRQQEQQQQQRTIDMNDPGSWTDADIDEMAQGDPHYEDSLRKQRQQAINALNTGNSNAPIYDPNDPASWTDEDIAKIANGDPELADDLIELRKNAKNGILPQGPISKIGPGEIDNSIPNTYHIDAPDTEIEGFGDLGSTGRLGVVDKVMTGVNILGAVGDYKTARREGHGVVSSAVRAGAKFAVDEALGLWAIPVALVKTAPGLAIKGADMLYKENRRMNSAANFQVFGDAQFMDTQQLATMRQSGMEMAKMSQYNLQQTLMGNEATYLHR